jgi:hypothetical protein
VLVQFMDGKVVLAGRMEDRRTEDWPRVAIIVGVEEPPEICRHPRETVRRDEAVVDDRREVTARIDPAIRRRLLRVIMDEPDAGPEAAYPSLSVRRSRSTR